MNLITVVFRNDLPNLLTQAYSLKKNWNGKKEWIIVVEDNRHTSEYIIDRILPLMTDWDINLQMCPNIPTLNGWWRQQICKFWAVQQISKEKYSLILDAKNFMINNLDMDFFFEEGCQIVQSVPSERSNNKLWAESCQYFNKDHNIKHEAMTLTPWVWNRRLVRYVINQYKKTGFDIYKTISDMPVWEFNAYWIFAQDMIKYKFKNDPWGFGFISLNNRTQDIPLNYKEYPFWTFHRRVSHLPHLLEFHYKTLKEKQILTDDIIKEVQSLWKN